MTYKAELDAAVAANENLTARVSELHAALTQANQTLVDVGLEINTARDTLETRTSELEEARKEINTLRDLVNAAEAKVVDFDAAVARAAQDALAQTGCDPVAVDPNSDPVQVNDDIGEMVKELKRLQKSDPAAATKYFREHKAALMAAKR